jgi:hypothetical protein
VEKLTYLKYLDFFFGGMGILTGLFFMLAGLGLAGLNILGGEIVSGVITLVVCVISGAIPIAIGAMSIMAGRGVEQGNGKIMQTIVSALMLPNFPIGTAVGGFGLWLMYANEETKAVFDNA